VIVVLAPLLAACGLAWVGAAGWLPGWAALGTAGVWAAGLLARNRPLFILGTSLALALLAASAWTGGLRTGLLGMALLLWSWDVGWSTLALKGVSGDARGVHLYIARTSGWVALGGLMTAFLFSLLQVQLSFWALLGLAALAWALTLYVIRTVRAGADRGRDRA